MNVKTSLLVFATAFAAIVAHAATTYDVEGTTLVATVPAGETNAFDSVQAEELRKNTYELLRKEGDGGLEMPDDLSAYTGAVTVVSGSLGATTKNSLGSLLPGNGATTVREGATLYFTQIATANTRIFTGKSFVLAGFGVNGAGALDLRSEEQKNPLGTNVTLTADTRVRNRTQYFWGQSSARTSLDMNGHTLYLFSENSSPAFNCVDIVNPGHLVIESGAFPFGDTIFGGSSANTITVNAGRIISAPASSSSDTGWTIILKNGSYMRGGTSYDATYNPLPGVTTNAYVWKGDVKLDATGGNLRYFQCSAAYYGGIALLGKLTGAGNFRAWGNCFADSASYHHPYLNLVNPENDYTGTFEVRYAGIRLWNPGVLVATSPLTLNEGEVAFDNLCDDFGALPAMSVNCGTYDWVNKEPRYYNVPYTNQVRFGRGTWKKVTKTGAELFWWYSGTGAETFDVQDGLVKLGARTKIAGLYSSQTNGYNVDNIDKLYANDAYVLSYGLEPGVRSPNESTHAYQNYVYNRDPRRSGDAQYALTEYRGYVWNNDPTNVTWSFVGGGIGRRAKLVINGETVFEIDYEANGAVLGMGNAVLKPGPNTFSYRGYRLYHTDCTSVRGWKFPNSSPAVYWADKDYVQFGFGYDPQGRGLCDASAYKRMEDPGDGSLFTFCLPGEEYSYPGHPDETFTSTQPDFALLKCADGAGFDLEGVTNYVAASVEGFPVFTNAVDVAITNTWTIPLANLGTRQLATDGRLDLSKATLAVDDISLFPRGGDAYRVCTAAGGISGVPAIRDPAGSKVTFRAVVTSDGKGLEILRVAPGMVIILK